MANNQIALLAQVPEFDPLVPAQRQAQLQALAMQREQRGLQLEQARQAAADDAAVRAAYSANPTDAGARLRALAGASPRAYAAEQKSQSDFAKTGAETRAKQIESAKQQQEVAGRAFSFVRDNPTLQNALSAINQLGSLGIYSPEEVAQYTKQVQDNPADIQRLAEGAYQSSIDNSKKLLQYEKTNLGGTTVGQTFNPVSGKVQTVSTMTNTQSPESVASVGATIRGQNIAAETANKDRVSREKVAANSLESKGEKPMTEFQGKSAGFADRAQEADTILNSIKYSPAALNSKASAENTPLIGGLLGATANAFTSSENQQAEQAQRNFINAILRQESGAAIGPNEFDNARKQYFPQPGDSKEVIDQKAANRKTAIAGLSRSAGPSYKAPSASAGGGGGPAKGTVEDGYRFKGGNAADPNNWEKI